MDKLHIFINGLTNVPKSIPSKQQRGEETEKKKYKYSVMSFCAFQQQISSSRPEELKK